MAWILLVLILLLQRSVQMLRMTALCRWLLVFLGPAVSPRITNVPGVLTVAIFKTLVGKRMLLTEAPSGQS